jgi:hypothetical protein
VSRLNALSDRDGRRVELASIGSRTTADVVRRQAEFR